MIDKDTVRNRLKAVGLELPQPPAPAGSYQPVMIRNGLGAVSGQVPLRNGVLAYTGQVGDGLSVQQGIEATQLAALNVLAQIENATDGWRSFGGLLRMEGYIASVPGFLNQPEILDGASKLFLDILGDELGAHARAAFSVHQVPLDSAVELVVTFAVRTEGLGVRR